MALCRACSTLKLEALGKTKTMSRVTMRGYLSELLFEAFFLERGSGGRSCWFYGTANNAAAHGGLELEALERKSAYPRSRHELLIYCFATLTQGE